MILSKAQVKEKLGVGDTGLLRLIEAGRIAPVNERRADAKKFFARFDSVAVNKLANELKMNGHTSKRLGKHSYLVTPQHEVDFTELVKQRSWKPVASDSGKTVQATTEPLGKGILSRLKSIEDKLDALLKAWS